MNWSPLKRETPQLSEDDINTKSLKARRVIQTFWKRDRPDRQREKYVCPKCSRVLRPLGFFVVEEEGWTIEDGIEMRKNHYVYFSCVCGYEYGEVR